MLRAMSQGNDGSMSSIHADSSKGAIVRLGMYTAEAGLDEETSNKWIANAVDLIIHLGWVDGLRRVTSVREVLEAEARQIATNEVYRPSSDGRAAPAPGPTIRNETLQRLVASGFDPAWLSAPSGRW
jgi:Flp pilus assembly CpaF family ATPase